MLHRNLEAHRGMQDGLQLDGLGLDPPVELKDACTMLLRHGAGLETLIWTQHSPDKKL